MEGDSVYHIEETLEQTKIRLNRDDSLSSGVKKAILEFIDDLTMDNLSKHRQYFYITRLKVLGRIMGDSSCTLLNRISRLQYWNSKRQRRGETRIMLIAR